MRIKMLQEAVAKAKAEATKAAGARRTNGDGKAGASKGAGKIGAGKGAGGLANVFPEGAIQRRQSDNKEICAKFNKGICTYGDACKFAHVCWWCESTEHEATGHA